MLLVIILITMLLIFLVQYVNRVYDKESAKEFAVQSIMGNGAINDCRSFLFIETLVRDSFSLGS